MPGRNRRIWCTDAKEDLEVNHLMQNWLVVVSKLFIFCQRFHDFDMILKTSSRVLNRCPWSRDLKPTKGQSAHDLILCERSWRSPSWRMSVRMTCRNSGNWVWMLMIWLFFHILCFSLQIFGLTCRGCTSSIINCLLLFSPAKIAERRVRPYVCVILEESLKSLHCY